MMDEKITEIYKNVTEIYKNVRDGKISAETARVTLTQSGAVPTHLPVHLTVRTVKPRENPGWSQQNNFKLSRNEIVFRLPK